MKFIANLFRILLGLVFIFSGFVKGIDPLGSEYKFIDYFNAFGIGRLNATALFFSFLWSEFVFFWILKPNGGLGEPGCLCWYSPLSPLFWPCGIRWPIAAVLGPPSPWVIGRHSGKILFSYLWLIWYSAGGSILNPYIIFSNKQCCSSDLLFL